MDMDRVMDIVFIRKYAISQNSVCHYIAITNIHVILRPRKFIRFKITSGKSKDFCGSKITHLLDPMVS